MKEQELINQLRQIYNEGYTSDELDNFIDNNFFVDELTGKVIIIASNHTQVKNPVLIQIVQLANSMYDSKEMDNLLEKL
jgi:hypothetical protein